MFSPQSSLSLQEAPPHERNPYGDACSKAGERVLHTHCGRFDSDHLHTSFNFRLQSKHGKFRGVFSAKLHEHGSVTQRLEYAPLKRKVVGSNPTGANVTCSLTNIQENNSPRLPDSAKVQEISGNRRNNRPRPAYTLVPHSIPGNTTMTSTRPTTSIRTSGLLARVNSPAALSAAIAFARSSNIGSAGNIGNTGNVTGSKRRSGNKR